ncbi:MAG TPA: protein translocase SEC61 complex subunit gamma [Thermoplasmata archaeon]|nr:protein translocase SEC61 complex subunit gamma [Thermoplasmata archaeon]
MSDIVEKSWHLQRRIEEKTKHIGKGKYGRVFKMARKPSGEEYIRISQITAIGLIMMGGLGFLIYWIFMYGADIVMRAFG